MDPAGLLAQRTTRPTARASTENRHVQGYLAYWDELRKRHPGLIIDSTEWTGIRRPPTR